MKITIAILISICLQASAKTYSQTVTLSLKDAPLEKVFSEIQKQTKFVFIYTDAILSKANKITIEVRNEDLENVLKKLFYGSAFAYSIDKNYIVIKNKLGQRINESNRVLEIDVKGIVTDKLGHPVVGASIIIKGTTKGTTTNDKGEFFLYQVDENSVIEISSLNFEKQEFKVTNNREINIRLLDKVSELNKVEVIYNTGYEEVHPERATGSFSQPDKVVYDKRIGANVIDKMEGITSGLLFIKDPVYGNSLQIRGYSTINASPNPLIVVDNFPYDGDITNINPIDVESITVLKDASAASIWGARAGNGVIVITTKRGKYNQPIQVNFIASVTASNKPDITYNKNFLNSADFIDVEKTLFNSGFYDPDLTTSIYPVVSPVVEILNLERNGLISQAQASNQIDALRNVDVRNDEKKYLYRGLLNQQYAINMSGGTGVSNYLLSVGFDNSQANEVGNKSNRLTINSIANFRPLRNLEITGGINYVQGKSYANAIVLNSGGPNSKAIYPYAKLADENGKPLPISKNFRDSFALAAARTGLLNWQYYPLLEKDRNDNSTLNYDTRLRFGLKYTIVQGISIEGLYQYSIGSTNQRIYYSDSSYFARNLINTFTDVSSSPYTNNIPIGGVLNNFGNSYKSQNGRVQLNVNKSFGVHDITFIGGFEAREVKTEEKNDNTLYGYNSDNDNYQFVSYTTYYPNYPSGNSSLIPNSFFLDHTLNRFRSYFANLAYSLKQKYFFSISGRLDQANLFGVKTNDKSVPLWSIGGKWALQKESFYHLNWLPVLQLKTTYGYSGNLLNNGTAYTTAYYYPGRGVFPAQYQINSPGNPSLTWEKIGMFNLGIEFGTKNNIISGNIEYYFKNGNSLIGVEPIPSSSGFTSAVTNYASMKGQGLDFEIIAKVIDGKNFQWTNSFLLSYVTDKITKYNPVSASGFKVALEGNPVEALYTYRWAGLDPSTGNPIGYDTTGKTSQDYASLIAVDVKHKSVSGRTTPNLFGGFRNTFSYKSFSLSINLSYKLGYNFLRNSINYYNLFYSWQGNADFSKRWKKPGDEKITNVPSLSNLPVDQNRDQFYNLSEAVVTKGDHVRIQDIVLSYDFDKTKFRTLPMKHIQLSTYINNVGIIWRANKYGIDPDYQTAIYIPPTTFALSLKANF